MTFWDNGSGRRPHVKAPTINPSSSPRMSNVALMNLVKYSRTISHSFCIQPIIEYESSLYLHSCMKFVRVGLLWVVG